MNISEFKKGDKIVRIEPTRAIGDGSYIGEKLTFIGVANGCIYAHREKGSFMSKITGETITDLRICHFDEGWGYWQNIEDIDGNSQDKIKLHLKQEIKEAIKNENYELIAELKNILDSAVK